MRKRSRHLRQYPCAATAESLETRIVFATFLVSALADQGAGSLRQAILNANATPGADQIVFAPGLAGRISLTSGELLINGDLTITGPGAGVVVVSGSNLSRVFHINDRLTSCSISGLTITGGNSGTASGGGLLVSGPLTLDHCVVTANHSSNSGGGAFVEGSVGNGSLIATNCTFSNNSAGFNSGGVGVDAALATLTGCTLSGNSAAHLAGGLECSSSEVTLNGCTVTGNSAPSGGGLLNYFGLTLANTTVTGNTSTSGDPDVLCVDGAVTVTSNSSVGVFTVSGGTLNVGPPPTGPTFAGAAAPAVGAGGMLDILQSAVFSSSVVVQPFWTLQIGSGGLTFTGGGSPEVDLDSDASSPGQLMLGGDVTFAGTSGTPAVRSVGTAALPGTVDLAGGQRSLVANDGSAADDLAIAAPVSDGALRIGGPGRVQLIDANTFAGGTTLANGTIEIDAANALGSGAATFAGGTLAIGAGVTSIVNPLAASAANSISLDVGANALSLQAITAGSALNVNGAAGGSLSVAGAITLQQNLTIDNSIPVTLAGSIVGPFGLTKTQAGPLTLSGSSGNTYAGTTTVNAGILVLHKTSGLAVPGNLTITSPGNVTLQASDQIAPSATLVLNAFPSFATFDLNGQSQTLGSISAASAQATIINNAGTLAVGAGGASSSFAGEVLGAGTFLKQGTGTFNLAGPFNFNGAALQITGGVVAIARASPASVNTVRSLTMSSGARLDLGNSTLMVHYAGGPDPAATIRTYLAAGYAGGTWAGPGLGTSGGTAGLGFGDSADGIVSGLAAGTIEIKPAVSGDVNLDLFVTFPDLLLLAQHYGSTSANWDQGDVNFDGKVGFADLLLLAQNYGRAASAAIPVAAAPSAQIHPWEPLRRVRLTSLIS